MKLNLLKTCVPISALLLLSGCIDDNYDLSDIDKTTQINVKDLVLPVNIDAIELSQIINLAEDSKIKVITIDGKEVYAVTQTGDFNSDPIEIDGFTAPAPAIDQAEATFELQGTRATQTSTYNLGAFTPQKVEFKATSIDESIKQIDAIDCQPLPIDINLTTSGVGPDATLRFPTLTLEFLKGLTLQNLPSNYSYDSKTGLLTVTNLPCVNNKAVISLVATAIDFSASGTKLEDHNFNYASSIQLKDAVMEMVVNYDNTSPDLPQEINFDIVTTVSDLVATDFTGIIEYRLEGDALNIEPVVLSDIPDFLSDEKTELLLANPQIYLSMNNPMATYDLGFQTGLQLTSIRDTERSDYNLDNGQLVKVGTQYGVNGPYNFVLSPSMPSEPLSAYSKNLTHVGFKQLSDVLEGDGIPQSIEIALIDPELPEQHVNRFRLFHSIPGIKGNYEFFAPLALKSGENGAVIFYTGTEDGWSDEDLDKMTITHLEVTADAFSNLPIGAEATIHPINKDGNKIPNLTITPANVSANANGESIKLTVSGDIRNLDGIIYEAVVRAGSEDALSPQQTLRLENIRAKVSGYYITDFN